MAKKSPKADIDAIIQDLQKKNSTKTPFYLWLLFLIFGIISNVAPIILYLTPMFDLDIKRSLGQVAISSIVSSLILAIAYNIVTSKHSISLLSTREFVVPKTSKAEDKDVLESRYTSSVVSEAAMFAVFAINLIFLVVFLFAAFSLLPRFELPPAASFTISTLLPSTLLLLLARMVY